MKNHPEPRLRPAYFVTAACLALAAACAPTDLDERPAAPRADAAVSDAAPRAGASGGGALQDARGWIAALSDGALTRAPIEHGVQLRVAGRPRVEFEGEALDLAQVRLAFAPEDLPADAVAITAPPGARSVYLDRRTEATSACVLAALPEDRAAVPLDCTSPGVVALSCPGASGEYRCRVREGRMVVSGPSIALAWERVESGRDLLDAMTPAPPAPDFLPLPICSPRCTSAGLEPCTTSCGSVGTRSCSLLTGCMSACRPPPEVCNGRDDDCDGLVDEDGATICNDGAACTVDSCLQLRDPFTGQPRGTPFCVNIASNGYCTNTWDSCDCNGSEVCAPDATTDPSGCVSPLPYDPTTSTTHAPCESDRDNCTIEVCCETDTRCRLIEALPAERRPSQTELNACRILLGRTVRSETGRDVHCPSAPSTSVSCNDSNPCTDDRCLPESGACTRTNVAIRVPRVGCGLSASGTRETVNEGCGEYACFGDGTCRLFSASRGTPTCGGDPRAPYFQSCLREQCSSGRCVEVPNSSLCPSDGVACTVEVCDPTNVSQNLGNVLYCTARESSPGACDPH